MVEAPVGWKWRKLVLCLVYSPLERVNHYVAFGRHTMGAFVPVKASVETYDHGVMRVTLSRSVKLCTPCGCKAWNR